tara:strand:+ start:335 stop:1303 length:969 start_codon:yes stop_codon:yes gene_type:complete
MTISKLKIGITLILIAIPLLCASNERLRMNEIQFIGSHNSYKQQMPSLYFWLLRLIDGEGAKALEYWHPPIADQLELGLRKLELDFFYDAVSGEFPVGHIQVIDMGTSCTSLRACLQEIRQWSDRNPHHVPIWISFNLKDQAIPLLPDPQLFTPEVLTDIDLAVEEIIGDRLIYPRDVVDREWPLLAESRGKILLVLDEGGEKRDWYLKDWQDRPMFVPVDEGHEAAAIMIINDPVRDFDRIRSLVKQGYLVRTRADSGTQEARNNDTVRRNKAFQSGAQAISTDYYLLTNPFDSEYRVSIEGGIRCNPVLISENCSVLEKN